MRALGDARSGGLDDQAANVSRSVASLSPSPKPGQKGQHEPPGPSHCPPQPHTLSHSTPRTASKRTSAAEHEQSLPSPKRLKRSSRKELGPCKPDPLSLNGILRQHSRARLYVMPLHWTSTHLQLLRCRFTPKSRISPSSLTVKEDTQVIEAEEPVDAHLGRQTSRVDWNVLMKPVWDLRKSTWNEQTLKDAMSSLLSKYGSYRLE